MAFRVQFNFKQQSQKLAGWTFSLWNGLDGYKDCKAAADLMRAALFGATGRQAYISDFRISKYPADRRAKLEQVKKAGPASSAAEDGDYPTTALLLKINCTNGAQVLQTLRGLPDGIVTDGGKYNPSGPFQERFDAFVKQLVDTSNNWCGRVLDTGKVKHAVTAIDFQTYTVTCPTHLLGASGEIKFVRLSGLTRPKELQRIWRATVIDANSFALTPAPSLIAPAFAGKNPTMREQNYVLSQFVSVETPFVTSHKVGKPTGLLSGRRTKRRS